MFAKDLLYKILFHFTDGQLYNMILDMLFQTVPPKPLVILIAPFTLGTTG